jgi:hypothetical protein
VTFKERLFVCACGQTITAWRWNTEANPVCPTCHLTMDEAGTITLGRAPGVFSDSIPGGVMIRHALCNPDGTPKRYDSMTAIREAAARRGYTLYGETPNPPNADGHVEMRED